VRKRTNNSKTLNLTRWPNIRQIVLTHVYWKKTMNNKFSLVWQLSQSSWTWRTRVWKRWEVAVHARKWSSQSLCYSYPANFSIRAQIPSFLLVSSPGYRLTRYQEYVQRRSQKRWSEKESYRNSFYCTTIREWNALPNDVLDVKKSQLFKNALRLEWWHFK